VKSKVCNSCLKNKSLHEYHKAKNGKFGKKSYCKDCSNAKGRLQKSTPEAKARVSEYNKFYCREKKRKANTSWIKRNYDHVLAYNSSRRAGIGKATPKWLNEEQKYEIESFYALSRALRIISGVKHHVDHIIPLQGENVCGLHVPWNLQVLTAYDNMSKGNSYDNHA
tara:strand:+ start:1464 stop:1964 length:501 start_codon:yes stop_codon:yes gene_type:complete